MEGEAPPVAAPRRRSNCDNTPSASIVELTETPYEKFMKTHTQAYAATKEGTILDEQGFKDKAFNSYQLALELIDKALQISYGGGFSNEEVNKVDEIVYKMRMTRKEMLERISDLQQSPSSPSYLEGPAGATQSLPDFSFHHRQPPAYSESDPGSGPASMVSGPASCHELTSPTGSNVYRNVASALDEIASSQNMMPNPLPLNAHEVFFIENEVQIYYIASDGNVSAPSYPSFLRVVIITEDDSERSSSQPPAFLQCGDWAYPLVQGQSPMLKSADGTYIFPDFTTSEAGCYVGLILPSDIPEERRKALEGVLLQIVGLTTFPSAISEPQPETPPGAAAAEPVPTPSPRRISSKIAEGLIQVTTPEQVTHGAEYISKGLQIGAEKTSMLLDKGTNYLVTKIDPAKEKPVITPGVKSNLKTAKTVTGKACEVSGFIVSQLSRGTLKLGQYLAPHIKKKATELYASASKSNEEQASQKVGQVLDVASGAFTGFSIVYGGLENAAKTLAGSLANNTVQIVHHRYGDDAGVVANDAAATVGNAVMTGYNCKVLGPKAVLKRAAKDTGKAVIQTGPKGGPGPGPGPGPSAPAPK